MKERDQPHRVRRPKTPKLSVDEIVAKLRAVGLNVVMTQTTVRIGPAAPAREHWSTVNDLYRALQREGHRAVARPKG